MAVEALTNWGVYRFEAEGLVNEIRNRHQQWKNNGRDFVIPGERREVICYTVEYLAKTDRVFIHFLEHAEVGGGNGGTVSKSIEYPSGRPLAHKVFSNKKSNAVQIERELEALTLCNGCPNVLQLVAVGQMGGLFEYMNGGNLRALGNLDPQQQLSILDQATQGVKQLHQKGIVHRDLCPENIFFSRNLNGSINVKIGDLGWAIKLDANTSIEGRGEYRSVAQARVFAQDKMNRTFTYCPSKQDDWHALAVTIYWLVHKQMPPFCQKVSALFSLNKPSQERLDKLPNLEAEFKNFCITLQRSEQEIDRRLATLF